MAGHRTPEIVSEVFSGLEVRFLDSQRVSFLCNCSWERFERALVTLGVEELEEMVDEGKAIETICHFCNKRYNFSVEDLNRLLQELGNTRA